MNYAVTSFPNGSVEQRSAPRSKVRLSARVETYSRYSLDSQHSFGDQITGVVITDLSISGLSAGNTCDLNVGSVVRLHIPRVGWRNAEIRWIRDGHAGCRFLVPLREVELRSAVTSNSSLSSNFPGLVNQAGSQNGMPDELLMMIVPRPLPPMGYRLKASLILLIAAIAMMLWFGPRQILP